MRRKPKIPEEFWEAGAPDAALAGLINSCYEFDNSKHSSAADLV
jgi:hypothetical protein